MTDTPRSHDHLAKHLAALSILGLALLSPRPADACGTMVFEAHAERPGGMDGQELFLSLGPDATTLVLSASFIGVGGDKAFLLPLRDVPTEVRDADDSLFIALETGTVPVVNVVEASDEGGGFGCGAKSGGDFSRGGESDVEVLDRGSTESYEYVVVGGDTGSALADWLSTAGFAVPSEFEAALDAYVDDGWYFLAARVAAGNTEGHLAPLELQLPAIAGATSIPFGIGSYALAPADSIGITLYVASQGSMLPENYAVETIDRMALEAASESTSNYADLFDELVGRGSTWVVEYSYGSWDPSSLEDWVNGDEEYGINVGEDVDPDWIREFHGRLGYDQARLTRLRTRLSGAELVDMNLATAANLDVDRDYYVTWDPNQGCGVTSAPADAIPLLFVLALVRRRRQRRAAG